jgi:hypothetical protein
MLIGLQEILHYNRAPASLVRSCQTDKAVFNHLTANSFEGERSGAAPTQGNARLDKAAKSEVWRLCRSTPTMEAECFYNREGGLRIVLLSALIEYERRPWSANSNPKYLIFVCISNSFAKQIAFSPLN